MDEQKTQDTFSPLGLHIQTPSTAVSGSLSSDLFCTIYLKQFNFNKIIKIVSRKRDSRNLHNVLISWVHKYTVALTWKYRINDLHSHTFPYRW